MIYKEWVLGILGQVLEEVLTYNFIIGYASCHLQRDRELYQGSSLPTVPRDGIMNDFFFFLCMVVSNFSFAGVKGLIKYQI